MGTAIRALLLYYAGLEGTIQDPATKTFLDVVTKASTMANLDTLKDATDDEDEKKDKNIKKDKEKKEDKTIHLDLPEEGNPKDISRAMKHIKNATK